MKDKQLRKMIADCLRYLCNKDGYWVKRESVEGFSYQLTGTETLDSISCFCKNNDIDQQYVHLEGWCGEGYDGYPEYGIRVFTMRKQTDKEYFDSLCSYILPTEYQQGQYETYLRLKKMFEGGA